MKRLKIRPIGPFRGDWRRRTGPRAAAITALCWIARLVIRPQPPDGQPLPFKPDLSIVIIKPIALGDVLRATVFVNALRRGLPNARITFAVGDYARAAIDNNPDIDEILPMQSLGTPRRYDAATYVSFVRRLRERSFDVAFVLDRSPAMALLPFFAGFAGVAAVAVARAVPVGALGFVLGVAIVRNDSFAPLVGHGPLVLAADERV